MLSRRLAARGYTVRIAEDGTRALELIATDRPELVLLDVMMPGISGLEVLRTVRGQLSMAELPVIMATARDGSEDVVEALRLGANDYVTKPLDFPVVLARVQTQLALKRQKDEIQRLAEDLEKRNRFIRSTFGRYLSTEVVESLFESPEGLKLGGEKRVVTIMMSDLRAFTALSERLDPEQVVRLLNRYLGRMTDIIMRYQGTIDEFLGDAILTIFGAPIARADDAQRALACATEMQLAMADVNAANLADGLPCIEMGIGLHTGEVVVGNIGSQKRTKYGVVGAPVNLTGRIEACTVGGQILASEATCQAVGAAFAVVGSSLTVHGKGTREPVTVWDIRGVAGGYRLCLAAQAEDWLPVEPPVRVSYQRLTEKQVSHETHEATLVRLSANGAEICCGEPLSPLTNLRLLFAPGSGSPLEAYAKVVSGQQDRARLCFTAVPPEAKVLLDGLRGGGNSASG